MSKKMGIIIVIGLIVLILIVIVMREMSKRQQAQSASNQQLMESQAILQALNLRMQREQIEAQDSASLGDWLDTIGNVAGAVGSFFTPGAGAVGQAASAAT